MKPFDYQVPLFAFEDRLEDHLRFSAPTRLPSVLADGDDYAADPSTTGLLEIDGPAVSGELEIETDRDWFAFTLTARQIVEFSLDAPDVGVTVTTFDATGRAITPTYTKGDFRSETAFGYEFQTAGKYYFSVEGI